MPPRKLKKSMMIKTDFLAALTKKYEEIARSGDTVFAVAALVRMGEIYHEGISVDTLSRQS